MKQALRNALRKTGLRRSHVAAARMCCERNLLATFGRSRARNAGRILCYHSIDQGEWGVNDVSSEQFRRHVELALKAGMRFVPASELARSGGRPNDLAITFDDGLRSVLTHAAPILRDYGVPWTFFPVTDWCDGRGPWQDGTILSWKDVETLLAGGAELGSHSVSHPDFGAIDLQQTIDELGESRRTIERRIGFAPTSFAIPLGQSMNWTAAAANAARELGYDTVFAQAEETRAPGTVARTFVTRFDGDRIFRSLLRGVFDRWEEWV